MDVVVSIQQGLPYLPAFVAAAEAGTFSEAAKRLSITQSAVSKQIQALERTVGRVLFDRLPRRLVLTEAGELLVATAQQVLGQLNDVSARIAEQGARRPQGPVLIGTTPSLGTYLLPGWLHQLVTKQPGLQPVVRFGDDGELIAGLQTGELDLAITSCLEYPDGLEVQSLLADPYRLVASSKVAAGIRSAASLAGLPLPLVLPELDDPAWARLEALVFRPLDWYPDPAWRLTHVEAMKRFVQQGFGATILPQHAVVEELTAGALVSVATPEPAIVPTIDLVRHRGRRASRLLSVAWQELGRVVAG